MKLLIGILLWCLLLVASPVLAIALLVLVPATWLISLPLRLALICAEAALRLIKGILLLPARLLGA